jgi:hypothetical protein
MHLFASFFVRAQKKNQNQILYIGDLLFFIISISMAILYYIIIVYDLLSRILVSKHMK